MSEEESINAFTKLAERAYTCLNFKYIYKVQMQVQMHLENWQTERTLVSRSNAFTKLAERGVQMHLQSSNTKYKCI